MFIVFGGSGTTLEGVTWSCPCTLPASNILSASTWESAAQNDLVNTNGESTTTFQIDAYSIEEQLNSLRDFLSAGNAERVLHFLTYESLRDSLRWRYDGSEPTAIQYWRQDKEQSDCSQTLCYPFALDTSGCDCESDRLLVVSLDNGDVCSDAVVTYEQVSATEFTGTVDSPAGCGFVEDRMTSPLTFSNMFEVAGKYMTR